ncbi:outer membrane usher protein FimD [Enterobacter asburiae]|uniref:fimbrial biogenesis usher protein n=1 Tax=Enterobacter asburiae TaxID=61645 RepID=UPI000DCEEB4E|nr:fimbrial biogenesis usher protein [Enterobacter asburiae]MBF1983157.1 fimbrial biogenesis usher protein [Enterobacter asburiae]MBJ6585849.1 fimbrial biogenesis usher protein [Enterobacter asburiae]MCU3139048.1 fimbrial biogenesis usher protein [Enterobacter asburiae]RAY91864.1 fimbrial protein FimD [Enterobacter asburiae]RTP98249.1 outer membrane usher protein FimD [Enterobacter asburiae]
MKLRKQARMINAVCWRLSPLALVIGTGLFPGVLHAENYFNPAFLADGKNQVADLSRFENDGSQAPGIYRVDIYLNNDFITSHDVEFQARQTQNSSAPSSSDDTGLTACLSEKVLGGLGLDLSIPQDRKQSVDGQCIDIATLIEGAKASFDFSKQRLDLSVPQVALKNSARGYIPPEKWDQGINALLLNYNLNGSRRKDSSGEGSSNFLGLNGGVNLGAWRYRDYSTFNRSTSSNGETTSQWQHISGFLERTIISLKSELTVGDSYTSGDVFDSVSFRGVQLASDDNMLPDSLKGFAPTVRGIAKSNAQVTIKQNGYVIYQTYVAPGAFAIDDLFPTSSSGDLTVEVKEQDGAITSYSVPYSAVPLLQREGRLKYSATAAKYRTSNEQQDQVSFTQGTLSWGLPHGFTLYGGAQLSDNYKAMAIGTGVNMGHWGALSADVTHAQSTLIDETEHSGQSLRLLYAKSLNEIGTNFQLLGYRYSTSGYYTFTDTTYKHMDGYNSNPLNEDDDDNNDVPHWFDYYNLYYTKRGKLQVNISQQVGGFGSIYLSGSQQSYWHNDDKDTLVQFGYNTTWKDINIGLSYNYSQMSGQPVADKMIAFNLSLPIGKWLSAQGASSSNNAFATYSMNHDNHGSVTQNAGISGTLLEGNNLSYSVQQGYGNQGTGNSGNASLAYQGGYGNANVGYSYDSSNSQQVTYGVAGGIVAHRHGITLSQPLGETNVLVEAPGADNVKVENSTGVKTDWRGYAVVPFATTYRKNRIGLDTTTLGDKVDLEDTVADVVPTKGALVRVSFKAHVGSRALITLLHNNQPVPFGATVTRDDGTGSIVGEDGQVYLSGLAQKGTFTVQWGEGSNMTCNASYQLPVEAENTAITQIKLICR